MFGPGNSVVMIEAVKEETKGRQEEVRSAVKNTGSGLCEWVIEEEAWLFTQFTKVALSVAVVRGVHQLFRIGFASESAYQRAPDLWTHGYHDRDHRSASGGYAHPGGGATGPWTTNAPGSRWVRVGVAFPNRDGSLNVLLDAIPLSGRLQIRDRAEPQNGKERPR
jgi:hypothetical protein